MGITFACPACGARRVLADKLVNAKPQCACGQPMRRTAAPAQPGARALPPRPGMRPGPGRPPVRSVPSGIGAGIGGILLGLLFGGLGAFAYILLSAAEERFVDPTGMIGIIKMVILAQCGASFLTVVGGIMLLATSGSSTTVLLIGTIILTVFQGLGALLNLAKGASLVSLVALGLLSLLLVELRVVIMHRQACKQAEKPVVKLGSSLRSRE